jgi:hypothetical protein
MILTGKINTEIKLFYINVLKYNNKISKVKYYNEGMDGKDRYFIEFENNPFIYVYLT